MLTKKNTRIAVIGGGSWGTALVKILTYNSKHVNWWVRKQETVDYVNKYHRNPNYLRYAELNISRIHVSSNLKEVIENSDWLILCIPSPFLADALLESGVTTLKDKTVVSAIKGIVPQENDVVGNFIRNNYHVDFENFGVIAGPCHSEEVVMHKLSFLTVAFQNKQNASFLQKMLTNDFMRVKTSEDILGVEYSAVLKNIYALASGICLGIGYGDNFLAVLMVNAVREAKSILHKLNKVDRDINDTVYMGDIIVTAYSNFSRNRMFGNFIGRGYSVKSTMAEMKMIAEGYYAVSSMINIKNKFNLEMPICEAVYNIVHLGNSPVEEMKLLEAKLS